MDSQEYAQSVRDKFYGKYRALVVKDNKTVGTVKIRASHAERSFNLAPGVEIIICTPRRGEFEIHRVIGG